MRILHIAVWLSLVTFGPLNLHAQVDSAEVNRDPYSVVYNHLYYLQPESYRPERAALSLPQDVDDKRDKSIKLKQVLDGKGMFIDLNRLPKNPAFIDSSTMDQVYYLDKSDPTIYLERINGSWFYSRTTMDNLEDMHRKVYPFGTQFITYFQAPVWQVAILSVKLWKWLAVMVILAASFILFLAIKGISRVLLRRFLRRRLLLNESAENALLKMSNLAGILIGIRLFSYFIPMLQMAPRLTSNVLVVASVLSLFLLIFFIRYAVRIFFIYLDKAAAKTENTMDDQLLPVLEKLSLIVLWAFGLIYIFDYLEVNITALLAGISIGGLALALAAQDTVKNLFGSVMIFLDKPFQIGDWISFGNVDGTVEEVGVRSTRIRTFANSLTYVPNALLADSVIDNMGLRIYRRFKMDIGVTYDTPPERIDQFVEGIRRIIAIHPGTKKDGFEVHLNSFGAYSINILVYLFFESPTWTDELKGKHQILFAIMKLAQAVGVRFAFPTQTLHVEELAQAGIPNTPFVKSQKHTDDALQDALKTIEDYFNQNPETTNE